MAGPNIFVVYDDASKQIVHEPTLDLPAAQALAETGQTAHTDGFNEARDASGLTVDAGISVDGQGSWYFNADTPHARQRKPDPTPIRTATRRWHRRHEHLAGLLLQEFIRLWKPYEDIILGERILHGLCAGTWMMWRLVVNNELTAVQFAQWLAASSLGPADGDRATATVTLGGTTLTVTLPRSLGSGPDTNAWTIRARRINTDVEATVELASKRIALGTPPTTTFAQAQAALQGLTELADADVVVTGTGTDAFPVPSSSSAPVDYNFSGATQTYDPNDPETFFEIAALIPANSALRTNIGGISLCNPTPPFTRRTIVEMLENPMTGTEPFSTHGIVTPTVAQLDRGRWLEVIGA